ncbi:hypothetical protein Q31b_57320 [Novipirellula aureliae]|uniref:Uncharacterized protein n=2 Tax=Novipirellula aureliae TaxID=2527966 RepID=A0A5C6DBU8_9BACT|nr:hypothetical protein Q31b_57320 [Novipirellula aureliae]
MISFTPTLSPKQSCSRDPIGYVDGNSLYRGYFVLNGLDPLGLIYTEEVKVVTLAEIDRHPQATPGDSGTTFGSGSWAGMDIMVESKRGCCYCTTVVWTKTMNLHVTSLIPSDAVDKLEMTLNGIVAVIGHEARRRSALRAGYYAYIAPVEGASLAGTLCRKRKGEAYSMLQTYVQQARSLAIEDFNRYKDLSQGKIDEENEKENWLLAPEGPFGADIFHGYKEIAGPTPLFNRRMPSPLPTDCTSSDLDSAG